jgi:hypothetical protein
MARSEVIMASSAPGVTAALRRGNASYEGFDTRKPAMASAVRSSRILRGTVSEKNALALSIGVLGALAVLLTGAVVTVPVWVVFIAWASFFILGGGVGGLVRSVLSNLAGIVIAGLTLLASSGFGLGLLLTAVAVGVGSAAMVQASRVRMLSVIPAIVWGFASTVGTAAVTGRPVTLLSLGNPVLMAAVAMVLGGLFGIASESIASALTQRPAVPSIVPSAVPSKEESA